MSTNREDDLLRQRALEYARSFEPSRARAETDVLLLRLGEDRYALELRALRAVQSAQGLAEVPCTPAFVAGILNVRGDVVTVLDLAAALDLRSVEAPSGSKQVLLVEANGEMVGLLVDEVQGVESIESSRLSRSMSGREYARGVDEGVVVLLSLEQLFNERKFEVLEEVT